MLLKVYDDFLPKKLFNYIQSTLLSPQTQWIFGEGTITNMEHSIPNVKDSIQFEHTLWTPEYTTQLFDLRMFNVLIEKVCDVSIKEVRRIKTNMLLKESDYPTGYTHVPHSDIAGPNEELIDNLATFLFYVNDSDGDTVIFNETSVDGKIPTKVTEAKRITPKANRGVLFDSNYYHASTPPRTNSRRVVINNVLILED